VHFVPVILNVGSYEEFGPILILPL